MTDILQDIARRLDARARDHVKAGESGEGTQVFVDAIIAKTLASVARDIREAVIADMEGKANG